MLKVRAFDGAYEDYCTVEIKISNVNDNPPIFRPYDGNFTITEEELVQGCITRVNKFSILFLFPILCFMANYNNYFLLVGVL